MNRDRAVTGPILAGVDGGRGTAEVVRAAGRLATVARAELVIAHIVGVPTSIFPEVVAAGMVMEEDAVAEILPEIWISLADADVRWQVVSASGVPASELLRLARAVQPSAIVVGADRSGWTARLRRGLNGSVPARLMRSQDAPVIVIPAACSHRRRAAATEHTALFKN